MRRPLGIAKKGTRKRKRRISPQRRIDVTRFEYQTLLAIAERNREAVTRLETALDIQFRRIAELQVEIDIIKRANGMA